MDMDALMAQAKELQDKVTAAQEQLAATTIRGIVGNGDVVVTMTGKYDVMDVMVSDNIVSQGAAAVSKAVLDALHDAKAKADDIIDRVMGDATAGMPMPE